MKTQQKSLDSFDVVERLISGQEKLSHFHILDVSTPPFLQERVPSQLLSASAVQDAIELKRRYGHSFWDAYLTTLQWEDSSRSEEVFRAALLHDKASSRLCRLKADEASLLRQMDLQRGPGQMLALSSLVELRGREMRHIPMLDFRCEASDQSLPLVSSAVRALTGSGQGLLLASGKSYHYYGCGLLTSQELIQFLARASLLGPIIDRRWIAHQILEGACALRIGRGHDYPCVPFVVAEFP